MATGYILEYELKMRSLVYQEGLKIWPEILQDRIYICRYGVWKDKIMHVNVLV